MGLDFDSYWLLIEVDGLETARSVGILPSKMITATETAERHFAALRLDRGFCLPLPVDEIVQRMVCGFRTNK